VEDLVHVGLRLYVIDQPEDGGRNNDVKASDKPQVPRTFGFCHFQLKSVKTAEFLTTQESHWLDCMNLEKVKFG